MLTLGDLYCAAWDVLKANYDTMEIRNTARSNALERVALASMQAEGIVREMEAR
jgi:hypothetical protein